MKQFLFFIVVIAFIPMTGFAEDWPMWRYDAGRTANSPEDLGHNLSLSWVHEFSPRETVWDDPLNRDLMQYDRIFEPIVTGKYLIIGFNDRDKVVALNTTTGAEIWTYYTDGPVRLPPVAHQKKIYVASDDGFLHCLEAKSGRCLWKFRGGPDDSRLIGNKRLISTWPARGGPVVADGVVYFAASIWPFMGTFIYALDAETGELVWENDGTGADFILQPHRSPAFAGVAPQGSLVVSGDKLLVPGGRSVPACLDRETGEVLYYRLSDFGKSGGSFVCAIGDYFFNHHREDNTYVYSLHNGDSVGMAGYPVLTDEIVYLAGRRTQAIEFSRYLSSPKDLGNSRLWRVDVDSSGDLIKVGSCLFAGGEEKITALELRKNKEPKALWTKIVDGSVERLLAADGRLFAVTLDGKIMAFSPTLGKVNYRHDGIKTLEPSDTNLKAASALLEHSVSRSGYGVIYGIEEKGAIEGLLTLSDFHFILLTDDGSKVQQLREHFDAQGMYGKRVAISELKADSLPSYMSSLSIVSAGYSVAENVSSILQSMRPYDGVTVFVSPDEESKTLVKDHIKEDEGFIVVSEGSNLVVKREGPLEGAGEWTHQYGNIANTAKSDDDRVKAPLGLLWFGGSSNMDVLPRHGHGPPEQVINGRLFIQGLDSISARDVFTGRVLWKTTIPGLNTYDLFYDSSYKDTPTSTRYNQEHLPGANVRGANFVATEDSVYVVEESGCLVLDATAGEPKKLIFLPPVDPEAQRPQRRDWAYIGIYGDILLGGNGFVHFSDLLGQKKDEYSIWTDLDTSASRELIAFDRNSGEILWEFTDVEYGLLHNAIVAGNGRIYLMDKYPPHIQSQLSRRGVQLPSSYNLHALDVDTGELLWTNSGNLFGSFLSYSEKEDILIQSTRPSRDMVRGEEGSRMVAFRGSDGTVIWDKTNKYSTFPILHNEMLITEGAIYDLHTGDALSTRSPVDGEKVPWHWERNYGCNYPIASEHLISFRSAAAGYYDLTDRSGTGNFGGFKSGCTSTLIAADGVLNAPDYTRTCSCSYQNQTSLAMVHMPENEAWTFTTLKMEEKPVERLGLNFGAPGDRIDEEGILWLDYPVVGGPSPDIVVSTTPEEPKVFRHHSSKVSGDARAWIVASGFEGLSEISVKLNSKKDSLYRIRLIFCQPTKREGKSRRFQVALQGQEVGTVEYMAEDIGKVQVLESDGIVVDDMLQIELTGDESILCGLEISLE